MKTNFFGEPILQPGDDIAAHFADAHDYMSGDTLTASDIEFEEGLNEVQAHDFPSQQALRDWLTQQEVDIDG